MIRLRFVYHPGLFSWLVRFAQYGFWAAHVEAVLPDGQRLSSWFLAGGVKIRPADYDAGKFARELFVDIEATPEQEARFYARLRSQLDKPYDWRAILSFYSRRSGRDWRADDSWFCSEVIEDAAIDCGIAPERIASETSRFTPRDCWVRA
jgi:hypothetical protein